MAQKPLEINSRYLQALFIKVVMEQANTFLDPKILPYKPSTEKSKSPFIDKSDFEDRLNIKEVMTRIELLYERQLWILDNILSNLTKQHINSKNNPFRPCVFGHAFRSMLVDSDLPPSRKLTLYEVFSFAVFNCIGAVLYKVIYFNQKYL